MGAILLALIVGTWNGNWFPSGRAEHRAHPDVEEATIAAAGRMLAEGLSAADPTGEEDVVLVLNEMRNRETVERLLSKIGRPGLKFASISAYRRRDRFDQQQDAIATTLPVAEAGWGRWRQSVQPGPPRGYAYAAVVIPPATTAHVYAVHLKANYGATTDALKRENRAKRTNAMEHFLSLEKGLGRVILAGDFNADRWRGEFAGETIFASLDAAGYTNLLELAPPSGRGTHPSRKYGDSALDYIMVKGLEPAGAPAIAPDARISDHLALFARVEAPEARNAARPVRSTESSPRRERRGMRPGARRGRRREPSSTP